MPDETTRNAAPMRDPACVEAWPECESGAYDPRCCRFPKSCSCTVHSEPTAAFICSEDDVDESAGLAQPEPDPSARRGYEDYEAQHRDVRDQAWTETESGYGNY